MRQKEQANLKGHRKMTLRRKRRREKENTMRENAKEGELAMTGQSKQRGDAPV